MTWQVSTGDITVATHTASACSRCGADVLPAMARCRECGHSLSDEQPPPEEKSNGKPRDHLLDSSSSFNLDAMYAEAGIEETPDRRPTAAPVGPSETPAPQPPAPAAVPAPAQDSVGNPHESSAGASSKTSLTCSGCGRSVQVPPSLIGKRVKCPGCGEQLPVPGAPRSAADRAGARRNAPVAADAREQLQGAVETALRATPPEMSLREHRHTLRRRDLRKLKQSLARVAAGVPSQFQLDAANSALEQFGRSDDSRIGDVLLESLQRLPPLMSLATLRILAERREPGVFAPLLRAVAAADEHALPPLLAACGQMGDPRSLRPLLIAAARFPRHGSHAVDAIVALGPPSVPPLIRVAQGTGADADDEVRCAALEALERLADPRSAPHLAKLVKDPDAGVRLHAVKTLAAIEHDATLRPLAAALADADPVVRTVAATGLARRPNPKLAPLLVRSLQDSCADVRLQAVKGLGMCGDSSVAPHLRPLLSSGDEELALAAAESIARLGDDTIVPELLDRLQREMQNPGSERGAAKIIDALRRLKDDRAVLPLVDLLGHPRDTIRGRAAEALGQIGDRAAVESVADLLMREFSPTAQAAAAKALGELGDPLGIPALEHALGQSAHVRGKAIISLGEIGGPRALRSLLELTKDHAPMSRYHATSALAKLGDRSAMSALEPLTVDADEMVRRGAFKALQELGDDRTLEEIARNVRSAAEMHAKPGRTRNRRSFSLSDLVPNMVVGLDSRQLGIYAGALLAVAGVVTLVVWIGSMWGRDSVVVSGYVANVAISGDGRCVAASRTRGVFEVWNVASADPAVSVQDLGRHALYFGPQGTTLLAVLNDATFVQLDSGFRVQSKTPVDVPGDVVTVGTSPRGGRVVTASTDGTCVCWNLETVQADWSFQVPDLTAQAVAVTEDGAVLCTSGQTGLMVWDVATGELLHELTFAGRFSAGSVRFDVSGRYLAAGVSDGSVYIWDLHGEGAGNRPVIRPVGQSPGILHFGDGQRLLVQCGESEVQLWLPGADEPKTFEVRARGSIVMSATPDGSRVVAGGDESPEIYIHDAATGELIATLIDG